MPIAGSIGAAFALDGNIFGAIMMFLMINCLYFPIKYFGLTKGYSKGIEVLGKEDNGKGIFDRLANMANVLGCWRINCYNCKSKFRSSNSSW